MKPAVMRARLRPVVGLALLVPVVVAIAVPTFMFARHLASVEPSHVTGTCPPDAWPYWLNDDDSCRFVGLAGYRPLVLGCESTTTYPVVTCGSGSSMMSYDGCRWECRHAFAPTSITSASDFRVEGRLFVHGVEVCGATDSVLTHLDGSVECLPARSRR